MINEGMYYTLSIAFDGLIVVLTVIGAVFACIQLNQIKVNRKRQFYQSRREKTVEMVMYYVQNTKKRDSCDRKNCCGFFGRAMSRFV